MSARPSPFRRVVRSRRIRAFVLISVALHVLFLGALVLSEDFRHLILGDPDRRAEVFPATQAQVQDAVRKLLEGRSEHLTANIRSLQSIREQLDAIGRDKLQRLRDADATREELIGRGEWPTAERPDPTAQFVARADVEPEAIPATPVPPLPAVEDYPDDLRALRDQVVALYRLHAPLEADVGRLFERYHALELAEFPEEPIPLSRALKSTLLDLPDRAEVDPASLDPDIRNNTDGRFPAFRERLTQITLDADEMVDNAQRWLTLARSSESGLADKFGEQFDMIPAPQPYYGAYLDPKLLEQVQLDRILPADVPVALSQAVGGERGLYAGDWISLNRWYIIGPFTRGQSRSEADLEEVFGPEVGIERGVDLYRPHRDPATGSELRWKHRAFSDNLVIAEEALEGGKRIEPYVVDNREHAVWYFYTPVYSAQDMTVVGSFASDDYGVCWVNGQRVYQSPPTERPWEIFTMESFRVVPLKKGVNHVLFKLENARGTTGCAVVLMTHHDEDLVRAIRAETRN